jgi:hypothetical protein
LTSVLLDSGPLVLLVCGSLRPDLVGTGKTKNHTLRQFERLKSEMVELDKHISLPNILTEASNHLGAGKQQPVDGSARALIAYVLNLEEIYQPSKEVVKISEYMNVGLADAAIISCLPRLKKDKVRVFTQDWELYNRLSGYEVDCVNIMHWATPAKHYEP